ncbi:MAG TPA: hypothetical protein VFG19_03835 [Geobacteraceae bacterium]|nr:hypothetical protein [Geobacteraceae bacterium]
MGMKFSFARNAPSIILTDDYNPLDFYDKWLKEELRKRILNNTVAEIIT